MSMSDETKYKFFQIFVIGLIGLISVLALFTISSAVLKKGPLGGGVAALESQAQTAEATAGEAGFEGWATNADGYAQILDTDTAGAKPVIVYFYAPWCPYCKRFHQQILSQPQLQAYLKEFNKVRIYPDKGMRAEQTLMAQFGAQGFPSFFVKFPGQTSYSEVAPYTETGEYRSPQAFIDVLEALRKGSSATGATH